MVLWRRKTGYPFLDCESPVVVGRQDIRHPRTPEHEATSTTPKTVLFFRYSAARRILLSRSSGCDPFAFFQWGSVFLWLPGSQYFLGVHSGNGCGVRTRGLGFSQLSAAGFAIILWVASDEWLAVFPWGSVRLWLRSHSFIGLQTNQGWRVARSVWVADKTWLRGSQLFFGLHLKHSWRFA